MELIIEGVMYTIKFLLCLRKKGFPFTSAFFRSEEFQLLRELVVYCYYPNFKT